MISEDDKWNIKNTIKNVDERKVMRERERKKWERERGERKRQRRAWASEKELIKLVWLLSKSDLILIFQKYVINVTFFSN